MSDAYHPHLRKTITDRYRREVKDGELDYTEVAVWAIREGLWAPSFEDQVEKCRRELAAAARDQKFTDEDGNKVRANYCVRSEGTKPNGQKFVQTVWAHIDVATYPFMEAAFAQRRNAQIDTSCQSYVDVRHFNKFRKGNNPPIQYPLDFTNDVLDKLQSTDYLPPEDTEGPEGL